MGCTHSRHSMRCVVVLHLYNRGANVKIQNFEAAHEKQACIVAAIRVTGFTDALTMRGYFIVWWVGVDDLL